MTQPVGAISVWLEGDLSKVVAGFNQAGAAVDRFGRQTDQKLAASERRFGAFGQTIIGQHRLISTGLARTGSAAGAAFAGAFTGARGAAAGAGPRHRHPRQHRRHRRDGRRG